MEENSPSVLGVRDGYGTIRPAVTDHVPTPVSIGDVIVIPPSQSNPPGPLWTARKILIFFLLSLVYFLTWTYVGLLAPFFPDEASKFGIASTEIGLIFGIYSLVAFLASFIYGSVLVPKMGPYFVLFSGLFLNGGATITFGYLNLLPKGQMFAVFCLIARGVSALGGSGCGTAVMVILIQEFREHLATVIGMLELFTGLGYTVGPVVGGALYSLGGFRLPLFVIGGVLLAALPIVWLLLPRMGITTFVGFTSIAFLDPTFQSHAAKFGLDSTGVGLLFLVYSVTYMVGTPIVGLILQSKNWLRFFMVIGFLLSAACLLFFGPAPFLSTYAGVPPNGRGMPKDMETDSMASGLYTGFSNLGGFVGPLVGGCLADYLDFEWTSTIMAGLVFLQTIVLVIFFSCSRRKPPEERPQMTDLEEKHPINKESQYSVNASRT